MELADALRDELSQVYRRLREQSHLGDFSLSQINAILRLEREGPMTVSQLAQAEGMRAQSMSTTAAGLK
ncbi:MarR family transcriptional regulator, partial [Thioclava sp. BHET1]